MEPQDDVINLAILKKDSCILNVRAFFNSMLNFFIMHIKEKLSSLNLIDIGCTSKRSEILKQINTISYLTKVKIDTIQHYANEMGTHQTVSDHILCLVLISKSTDRFALTGKLNKCLLA